MRTNDQAMMTSTERYDGRSQSLHWISSALVVLAFGIALGFDLTPARTFWRSAIISTHVIVGVLFALVLLRRFAWRASGGSHLTHPSGVLGLIGRLTHWALYLLLLASVVTSVGVIGQRGLNFFDVYKIAPFISVDAVSPFLPAGWNAKRIFLTLHENGAWIIMGLASLHALAALFHHFVLRDGILRRMMPAPSQAA